MRIRIGFGGVLLLALAAGAFMSWYAVPTAYDQTSSAQKMQKAAQMMSEAKDKASDPAGFEEEVRAIARGLRDPASPERALEAAAGAKAREALADIRAQLQQGRSREEIVAFLVERYGEAIKP